jgi:fructokinase
MRAGIDLGGTKIEILVLDAQGNEKYRNRVATPRGDYSATLQALSTLVENAELSIKGKVISVGVGTPGTLSSQTGFIKNSNSTWLIGKPLDQDLVKILGRPVKLANDANCFVLSEATDGAAAGSRNVFGVILGTGVGAGIVIDGKILSGVNGIAGEWGHNPLPWPRDDERPGPTCYCGKQGCIETFLSGPGLAADFLKSSGKKSTGEEIVKAADNGNRDGKNALDRYENRLARGLAHVINILDPEIIVLGGGLSNNLRFYENIPRQWGEFIFSDSVSTRLVRAKFGDASGVRGAAWLFK